MNERRPGQLGYERAPMPQLSEREQRLLALHPVARQYIYSNETFRDSSRSDEERDAARETRDIAMSLMLQANSDPNGDKTILGSLVEFVQWNAEQKMKEYQQAAGENIVFQRGSQYARV